MKNKNNPLKNWMEEVNFKARVKAVCKPCWEIKYCPYGILVEQFPYLLDSEDEKRCRIFGHECPVFTAAEPFTETKELRKISRSISRPTLFRVLKRDNQICRICGKSVLDEDIHFDHIIPWSKGGSSEENNIQLLCSDCNRKKSNNFEDQHLVKDSSELVSVPIGYEILEYLFFISDFSHHFFEDTNYLPASDDFANLLAEGEKTEAEIAAAETVSDMADFFGKPPPKELSSDLFAALRYRWGFETGHVMKLSQAKDQYNVRKSDLLLAEIDFIKRLVHKSG